MRPFTAPGLCLALLGCTPMKAASVPPPPEAAANTAVTIKATCETGDPCVYRSGELHILIAITNRTASPIGFPLAFVQKTGPSIRLTDSRGGEDFWLRTNLAPDTLREDFTTIQPSGSVTLRWLIHASELEVFTRRPLDVTAEISVAPQSLARKTLFLTTGKLRITGPK